MLDGWQGRTLQIDSKHPFKLLSILIAIGLSLIPTAARADPPEGDPRVVVQEIAITEYEWWLMNWSDSQLACTFFSRHADWPTRTDVIDACGKAVYKRWAASPDCPAAEEGGDASGCAGLYLFLAGSRTIIQEKLLTLPPASVTVSVSGCDPIPRTRLCRSLPSLRISGKEPIKDERIIQINITVGNQEFSFPGATAELPLGETPQDGELVTFWADSSFGDYSPAGEALFSVIAAEDGSGWYVSVLSDRWSGTPPLAFSTQWAALPPGDALPGWLSPVYAANELASDEPYSYLGGQLIMAQAANAAACADGGLLSNGYASPCGVEQVGPQLQAWQNRFDQRIFEVAEDTQISAQLLKNLIAKESHFWPQGNPGSDPAEYGLAHLTEWGADTTLMWNEAFFAHFCASQLHPDSCAAGYAQLPANLQASLQGALLVQADAACADCPLGVDLTTAEGNVELLAQSLLANAAQVGQMLTNLTATPPGAQSSYEDLWRFVLVNYNAGPGCLGDAFQATLSAGSAVDWSNVSTNLEGDCRNAIEYVGDVTR
jgi:hypothetical protein